MSFELNHLKIIEKTHTLSIEIEKIKNSVEIFTLKAGTLLYRFSKEKKESTYKCNDTGKEGLYFSNNKIIPLGMCLEYNNPGFIHTYQLKRDIILYKGKYSFRKLEFERFYENLENFKKNNFTKNINPYINYNHLDKNIYPIHNEFNKNFWKRKSLNNHEIFIGKETLFQKNRIYSEFILKKIYEPEIINYDNAYKFIQNYKNS